MSTVTLNATKGGINRLRTKGGASPNHLYELLNGYVDSEGRPTSRPGSREHGRGLAGTKGLCAFNGAFVVFAVTPVVVPAGYSCEVIAHPFDLDQPLKEIHFAGPYLGYLYVVAEFGNGDVFHYWLQKRSAWKAETGYLLGEIVEPTVRNGFAYRARRISPPAAVWAPNVPRAVGDKVEPTVANGFVYTVVDVQGASPKSGANEPKWPAANGATIFEDTELGQQTPGGGTTTPVSEVPPDVQNRYSNFPGRTGLRGVQAAQ